MVAVVDQPDGGFALVQGHAQGVEDQFAAQVIGHRPADDAAGERVEHDQR